ncbi:unnamed protein product [Ranitomeya imitator]|uniref:Uncharacterized protein n=1 Tax=Ranitomeya imitator TaxID=111125 RepID=A0ABN9LCA4_9NEOB|nr:unnamed protein product [Ranitomeya imitator]
MAWQDDNECQNATYICGDHANCTNTKGSYFCMCAPGYASSSGAERFMTNDGTFCRGEAFIDAPRALRSQECIAVSRDRNAWSGHRSAARSRKGLFWIRGGRRTVNTIKEPIAILQEIQRSTTRELLPVDVISYVEVLAASSPLLGTLNKTAPNKEALTNTTITTFVNTVNNFVEKDKISVWKKLTEENRKKSLTKLLHTTEQLALEMSQNFQRTTQVNVDASDMALKLFTFDSNRVKHIHPHALMEGDYIKISPKKKEASTPNGKERTVHYAPVSENIYDTPFLCVTCIPYIVFSSSSDSGIRALNTNDNGGTVSVVFLRYDNIGSLLASSEDEAETDNSNTLEASEIVNSPVIAAAINSNPPTLYQLEKILFILKHLQCELAGMNSDRIIDVNALQIIWIVIGQYELSSRHKGDIGFNRLGAKPSMDTEATKCAFWKYAPESLRGEWSTGGCEVEYSNISHTACKCDHLTHFAILMSSPNYNQAIIEFLLMQRYRLDVVFSSTFLLR